MGAGASMTAICPSQLGKITNWKISAGFADDAANALNSAVTGRPLARIEDQGLRKLVPFRALGLDQRIELAEQAGIDLAKAVRHAKLGYIDYGDQGVDEAARAVAALQARDMPAADERLKFTLKIAERIRDEMKQYSTSLTAQEIARTQVAHTDDLSRQLLEAGSPPAGTDELSERAIEIVRSATA